MAEENPHIVIKVPPKRINNSREQYLYENEKLILGRPGFIFRAYPTLKERLQQSIIEQNEFNRSLKNHKNSRNKSTCNISNITQKSIHNSKLNESKSELNIFSQPILRFKNRTDFERICDTIQQYVKPSEQEELKEIRARHVKSIDFPTGLLYKGGFKELKRLKSLKKSKGSNIFPQLNNTFSKIQNEKLFKINNKNFDVEHQSKPKIFFTRLQRLNEEAKKIRSNLHYKTHFKAVESVFINPKQINEIIKRDLKLSQNNIKNYAYNENIEKDNIEKRNEYKNDIRDLLLEEQEKQSIINTKEFSNYLNNKEYYNDRVIIKAYNDKKENEEEKVRKINNMNYLRGLAFKDSNHNDLLNNDSNNSNNINIITEHSSNDGKNKLNALYENENQIRIGGKIYHMQNQMDLIAKEILHRCKFYSTKK